MESKQFFDGDAKVIVVLPQARLNRHHNLLWCRSAPNRPIATVSTVFTSFKELLPNWGRLVVAFQNFNFIDDCYNWHLIRGVKNQSKTQKLLDDFFSLNYS